MAQPVDQSPYFTERRANGGLIVSDSPKFDLESYAANYDRMS
jgi:COP9 signalosome complex subunit 1